MNIPLELGRESYDIILERGSIRRAGELLNLNRKVFLVTDDGVPAEYAQRLKLPRRLRRTEFPWFLQTAKRTIRLRLFWTVPRRVPSLRLPTLLLPRNNS